MAVASPTVHPQVGAAKRKLDEFLLKNVQALFAGADDMLFQMSEKAAGTDKQGIYFDAMRQLRTKRNDLQSGFIKAFGEEYKKALKGDATSSGARLGGLGGLSLVDESELQEGLAVTNLVEKATNANADVLFALAQRFGYLLGNPELDDTRVPIGPKPICEAFRTSLGALEKDTALEVRLILFKLFEKFVTKTLPEVYAEINDGLIRAGVMPEIKMKVRKSEDGGTASRRPAPSAQPKAAAEGVTVSADAAEALAALSFLDDTVDGSSPDASAQSAPASASTPAPEVDMSVLDTLSHFMQAGAAAQAAGVSSMAQLAETTQNLVKSLSALQQVGQLTPVAGAGEPGQDVNYSDALIKELEQVGAASELGAVDANTINIVGMLFEFILDDRNIPGSLRALISKLQLPFLKVALIDKSFFHNFGHPARRLLNELGQASIGWREGETPQDDPLYKKIEEIVERVLKDFEDDVGLFQTLLDDLYGFLEHDNVLAESKEILIERSRNVIKDAIESRLKDVTIPRPAVDLIVGPWRDLLAQIHDQEGVDSEAWTTALQTLDDLIWSVLPRSAQDRGKLAKMLPKLLGALAKGFNRLGYDPERIDGFMVSLQPMHVASLHGKAVSTSEPEPDDQSNMAEDDPDAERKREAESSVRSLAMGDWVEFVSAEGKTTRGKLVWHDDFLDDYTFVGRTFKVVADKGAAELIDDFFQGRALRLDNIPLIDRALDAVMMKLRS